MTKYLADPATQMRPESETPLRDKLMVAASAGILALAAPGGLYGMRAEAQTLPTGLSGLPSGNGDMDDCVEDLTMSGEVGPISGGGTLTIGDGMTELQVGNASTTSTAVSMDDLSAQTLDIQPCVTVINSNSGTSQPTVNVVSVLSSVTVTNDGTIINAAGGRALYVSPAGGDLIVNSANGAIEGSVYIRNYFGQDTDLDFGNIVATTANNPALEVYASGTTTFLTLDVGAITSELSEAIDIDHDGLQAAAIDVSGMVRGTTGIASDFRVAPALTMTLGKDGVIEGTVAQGVNARSDGVASVNTSISGYVDQNTGALHGSISGAQQGIDIISNGGDILIEDLAAVAGGTGAGILARSTGGEITIRNIDNVTSEGDWAIDADTRNSDGNGGYSGGGADISIQNLAIPEFDHDDNAVTADIRSANGIRAFSGTGNINIGAGSGPGDYRIGDIYTTGTGILAESAGGAVTIHTEGKIYAGSEGINVEQTGTGLVKVTTDGNVVSDADGIYVDHTGSGNIEIESNGTIMADEDASMRITAGDGIEAKINIGSSGNIKVTANAAIDGGREGVRALNFGTGSTYTNSVYINAEVKGGNNGLYLGHDGGGLAMVRLDTNGTLIGETKTGLLMRAFSDGAEAFVAGASGVNTSGRIQGAERGANLFSNSGNITIKDLISVSGGTDEGIFALSQGGEITIENIGTVASRDSWAINAETRDRQSGGGYSGGGADISIQKVGLPVSGGGYSANGIRAYSGIGNINIGADASQSGNAIGNISVVGTGIHAETDSGTVDITVAGNITTTTGDGIYAGSSSAGAITIAAQGELSTGGDGIDVDQSGLGAVSVTTQDGITAGGRGIKIESDQAVGVTLSVQGDIDAVGDGINLYNRGGGAAAAHNIYVNAIVRGADGLDSGRYGEGSTTLTMSAEAEIIGETRRGVFLQVYGDTSTALIDGGGGVIEGATYGVFGDTDAASFTVKNLARVRGGTRDGIFVNSQGGAIIIENIDTVFSQSDWAIDAAMTGDGDVTINSVAVLEEVDANDPLAAPSRSANGLRASSQAGDITIGGATAATAIGPIYTSGTGIYVTNGAGDITINTAGPIDASGGIGIRADSGGGDIEINSTGSVRSNNIGIAVESLGVNDASINLQVQDVTAQGGYNAIFGITDSTEVMTLSISGNVQAYGSASSVAVSTASGADITVASGGSVAHGVAGGKAIEFTGRNSAATNDTLTLEGSVAANVLMGSGDDQFDYGGAIGAGAVVYGGDGTDTLTVTSTVAKTLTNTGGDMDAIRE
ncbi:MAG: hypothetical protein AAFO74_16210, partial [Pseudomonadota bacterium]